MGVSFNAHSQITHSVDISDVTTDSTYYFSQADLKYSYPMGQVIHFYDVTGGSGTVYFLNSPTDSLNIVAPNGGAFTVTSDTTFALTGNGLPFERYGFYFVKGTLTGGNFIHSVSRKTSK